MADRFDLMMKIIERAEYLANGTFVPIDRLTSLMDMDNANKQYPLDLEALLAADDLNFIHDFFGIRQHMNRQTGMLEGYFVPRFFRPRKDQLS